jgi:hypothetical protein
VGGADSYSTHCGVGAASTAQSHDLGLGVDCYDIAKTCKKVFCV